MDSVSVTTISELHWSLSTGTFRPRFQAPSVSPQLRGNVALKASQPFVGEILINHEFLILHDVRKRFFNALFSGVTALTALNRYAGGVNGGPCRYKGVNGVLLEI